MTVQQLDANLGTDELEYWRAVLSRHPAREIAEWNRTATLAQLLRWLVTAYVKDSDRKQFPPPLGDFIPDLEL